MQKQGLHITIPGNYVILNAAQRHMIIVFTTQEIRFVQTCKVRGLQQGQDDKKEKFGAR